MEGPIIYLKGNTGNRVKSVINEIEISGTCAFNLIMKLGGKFATKIKIIFCSMKTFACCNNLLESVLNINPASELWSVIIPTISLRLFLRFEI